MKIIMLLGVQVHVVAFDVLRAALDDHIGLLLKVNVTRERTRWFALATRNRYPKHFATGDSDKAALQDVLDQVGEIGVEPEPSLSAWDYVLVPPDKIERKPRTKWRK